MKLQVMSDLHLEYSLVLPPSVEVKSDALALVGDIGHPSKDNYKEFVLGMADRFPQVYIVLGNHEFYGSEYYSLKQTARDICQQRDNLHLMDQNSILYVNPTNPNDQVRLIGTTLWSHVPTQNERAVQRGVSDYSYILITDDKTQEQRRITIQDTNSWHAKELKFVRDELQKAKENGEKVIVLTHHAPLQTGCSHPDYTALATSCAFQSPLQDLMNGEYLKMWIYGHTHYNADLNIGGTRVVSNQKGYLNERIGFNPNIVFEV